MTAAIPKRPKYKLDKVFQLRDQILDEAFLGLDSSPVSGADFQLLVAAVASILHVPEQLPALQESLHILAGRPATEQQLFELAWRLAGNVTLLQQGRPVLPWSGQQEPEWVPLQIRGCRPHRTRRGKFGGIFTFRAIAGTPCPLTFDKFWSTSQCTYFGQYLGFNRSTYQMLNYRELVSLRLYGLVEAAQCYQGRPGFEKLYATAGMEKWNKGILSKRRRRGFECPRGYQHECYRCPVGYAGAAGCPAAVHARHFLHVQCDSCGRERWLDPEVSATTCLDCMGRSS